MKLATLRMALIALLVATFSSMAMAQESAKGPDNGNGRCNRPGVDCTFEKMMTIITARYGITQLPNPAQLPMDAIKESGEAVYAAYEGWYVTPDKKTGLGDWTEKNFIDTIRTGKKLGKGRPILPPMPIAQINNYSDDELRAIFAYLQSLPPISNAVPEPIPPAAPPQASATPRK